MKIWRHGREVECGRGFPLLAREYLNFRVYLLHFLHFGNNNCISYKNGTTVLLPLVLLCHLDRSLAMVAYCRFVIFGFGVIIILAKLLCKCIITIIILQLLFKVVLVVAAFKCLNGNLLTYCIY